MKSASRRMKSTSWMKSLRDEICLRQKREAERRRFHPSSARISSRLRDFIDLFQFLCYNTFKR